MKFRLLFKTALSLAAGALFCAKAMAQNPYLPLWEYIPDAEPYIFEDPDKPGEYRVYIYGSHDSLLSAYCGLEQVAWSAPVNDLSAWRYDGIIFKSETDRDGNINRSGRGDVLYAPDMVERIENGKKFYYLYPNNQARGRADMVAKSDRPDGPFKVINWSASDPQKTEGWTNTPNLKIVGPQGFDPGVFIDDDGRAYLYWGFEKSYGAELDPNTMCTVKPGTKVVEDMVSNYRQEGVFRFFEASSIRKIKNKYVFVYSRYSDDGEWGLPRSNNTLAYAYSDSPLGPWTYGGTIIDARARGLDESGKPVATVTPGGNTHGSIIEIGGQWWVFYHRQTGTNQYSRQAMVAPISVTVDEAPGGKVTITEGEVTSEGFSIGGLNPLEKTAAGIACYLTCPTPTVEEYPNFTFSGSYVKPTYINLDSHQAPFNLKQPFCPVTNNTAGSVVGYKYFNFDAFKKGAKVQLALDMIPNGVDGEITIMTGSPFKSKGGKVIGTAKVDGSAPAQMSRVLADVTISAKGKQAVYLVFDSATKGKSICELYSLQFIAK